MKQNIIFLTVIIIFAILAAYFFNKGGRINDGIGIFMVFGCFLTLCAGADDEQLKQ
jgi:ABC-type uncharacterized transport system permease subunit